MSRLEKSARFQRLICTEAVRSDLRGRSVRAALFTSGASFADVVLRIGSTAVLARLLVPEQFGLVMMAMALTAIAEQLRDFGLSTAIVQKQDLTHSQVSNLFWLNLGAGLVLALSIASVSPLIAAYYREPRLVDITLALSMTFVFGGAMAQHQALLTRQLRLAHTSAVRLAASVAGTGVAIAMAWYDFGHWSLVGREIVRSSATAIGMWGCLPWVPSRPTRGANIRPLVAFGANLTAANLIGSLSAAADRLVLGRFAGAASVGLFRQAHQLMAAPVDQLVSPIYQVSQPGLSMLQNDPARYRAFYKKMVSMVCLLTMPLSLFAAVHATEITALLLGPQWADAAPIVAILSLGAFIKQPVGTSVQVMISLGRTRQLLYLSIVQNATLAMFICIGVQWGIQGVAIAEVAAIYLLSAPRLLFGLANSPVGIRGFIAAAKRPAIASVAMAVFLLGLRIVHPLEPAASTLALGAIAGPLFFYLAWLLLPGGKLELTALVADLTAALKRRSPRPGASAA